MQNVGEMRMCFHRPLPESAIIKHAIIKCVNLRWYVCLAIELPDAPSFHRQAEKAIGVDVSLYHLLALSDGRTIENPHWMRESLTRLRILKRRASRRKIGSHRRQLAYRQVALLHEHIADQHRDCLHKVANSLVSE